MALALALALAACGSSGSDSSSGESTGSSGGGSSTTASSSGGESCSTEPVTVGFVPKLDTDPYWHAALEGSEKAQQEIGGEIKLQAPSQATADAQTEIINNMVTQGVDVIAVAGNDPNAVAPALERAMAAGVKVISYDSDVAPQARTLFVSQAESEEIGTKLLESMGQLLGDEGEFATLTDGAAVTNQQAWVESIKEGLSNPKYKKMKLVKEGYGEANEQTYQQEALATVRAYPNLSGLIVPAGIGLPAVARALEEEGLLNGRIKLTGLAPASLMRKYIESGSVQDIWWNVPNLGYLTYYAAQALAQCEIKGEPGETFQAGELGTAEVGKEGVVLLGPAEIVTKQNLSTFPF